MLTSCTCQAADLNGRAELDGSKALNTFTTVRKTCAALREILLPDTIWGKVLNFLGAEDPVAGHTSISFLAYRRGCLAAITEPMHRFLLMESGVLDSRVRSQYLKDLQEKWLLDPDPGKRHSLSRRYRGRIVELQFARWLELGGEIIAGLEAWQKGSDIRTISPSGVCSYEVKFIGLEDDDFTLLLNEGGGSISPYVPVNYLLFRIYEAAKQLESADGSHNAIIAIDEQAWFRFERQIEDRWITKNGFAFFDVPDDKWNRFIRGEQEKYPTLPGDVPATIRKLDQLKIFRQGCDFKFIQV